MCKKKNRESFHLWCERKNLLKHQKVSKYDEEGCSSLVFRKKEKRVDKLKNIIYLGNYVGIKKLFFKNFDQLK